MSLPPEVRDAGILAGAGSVVEVISSGEARTVGDALFHQLFEAVPVAVVLLDPEGRVLRANRPVGRLFGYPVDRLLGRDLGALIVPEFLQHERHLPGRFGQGGVADEFATVRRRADGGLVEVSVSTTRIEAGGETLAYLVIYQELPDRQRAAAAEPPDWWVSPTAEPPAAAEDRRERRVITAARAALDGDGTVEVRLTRLTRAMVPDLADSCILYLLDRAERVRRVEVAFADPGQEQLLREQLHNYPPDIDRLIPPVARALRVGESQLIPEVSLAALKAVPGDRDHVSVAFLMGLTSLLVVPLVVGERVCGAMSFATAESGRRYHADDMSLAEEVARYATRMLGPHLA